VAGAVAEGKKVDALPNPPTANCSLAAENQMIQMNRNPKVDEYLKKMAHPMNAEIQRVREIILKTHPEIEETIKWNSPTFLYKGNMASYFMNAKKHVSLMFHKGAFIKDKSGLLEGEGKEGRVVKFSSLAEIEKRKGDLESIIKEWIKMQDKL
jgi:hypothetical protein